MLSDRHYKVGLYFLLFLWIHLYVIDSKYIHFLDQVEIGKIWILTSIFLRPLDNPFPASHCGTHSKSVHQDFFAAGILKI